jgi:hypothetical protein
MDLHDLSEKAASTAIALRRNKDSPLAGARKLRWCQAFFRKHSRIRRRSQIFDRFLEFDVKIKRQGAMIDRSRCSAKMPSWQAV